MGDDDLVKTYFIVSYELYKDGELVKVGEESLWRTSKERALKSVEKQVKKIYPECEFRVKEII